MTFATEPKVDYFEGKSTLLRQHFLAVSRSASMNLRHRKSRSSAKYNVR